MICPRAYILSILSTGVTTRIYQLGGPLRRLRKQYPHAEIRVTVGVTEKWLPVSSMRASELAFSQKNPSKSPLIALTPLSQPQNNPASSSA